MPEVVAEETGKKQESGKSAFLFKPGVSGNPAGRPRGARSKLGEEFVAALQADFGKHGEEVIRKVREEKPDAYLKVLASILPKELNVNTNALGDMSDDELTATLLALRDLASTLDAAIVGAGAKAQGEREQTLELRAVQ